MQVQGVDFVVSRRGLYIVGALLDKPKVCDVQF